MVDLSLDTGSDTRSRGASRDKILQAAAKEFAQRGLAGARVDRIASGAGVNKAMIYYHFSSKEGLYREVIKELIARRATALSGDIAGETDLAAVLRRALDFHAELLHRKPETVQIYLRELADPKSDTVESVARIIRESGLPDEFTKMLAAGMRSGAYRAVDVRQAVISFITMSIGYYLMSSVFSKVWQFTDEPAFIEERKKAIIDLFMNGVKAR
ncbi:MAG: TetR/AcrR family transcriptional regulator [Candidatus Zixiibacteriota bacterium]|nr:MAG: TetR/AcrR family transcriptional regulator [candidate division Zixibacteria bacterium]